MVRYEIQDSAITKLLTRLHAATSNLAPVMESIGDYLQNQIMLAFNDQKDPWGRAWHPLSKVTQERRRKGKGKGDNQILRDSGRLANSIVFKATSNMVEVGTNVIYAGTHQFGAKKGQYGTFVARIRAHLRKITKPGKKRKAKVNIGDHIRRVIVPWGDIPARPFMPIGANLPKEWQSEIMNTISRRLEKILAN